MKKFFILLMVVIMLVGLTSISFAGNSYKRAGVDGPHGYVGNCPNPECPNPDCPNPDCPNPDCPNS